jgi:CelD/BcsL family acetyltransferase involved in cellulose biosynthesis
LRDEWTDLLEASAANCIFLTWEWLWTWWRHFGQSRRLLLLTVRCDDELVASAPLALGLRHTRRLVPFRSLEFLGTGDVGSDYLDFIVRNGHETAALEPLVGALGRQPFAVDLRQLAWPSRTADVFKARLARHGWSSRDEQHDVCPFIHLSGHTWSSYLASLDGHHRNGFRRRSRQLASGFDMRLQCVTTEEGRRDALRWLIELHQRRWRDRGGSTAFHSPQLMAFHEEFTRRAAERGWLRLLVLHLDGEPAAAVYGLRYGPTFHFYQTGFDPRFGHLGVGQVVVGLSIKLAIEEGAQEYDFLHGAERYKFDWAHQVRRLGRLEGYPGTLSGRLHREAASLSRGARATARRVVGLARAARAARA